MISSWRRRRQAKRAAAVGGAAAGKGIKQGSEDQLELTIPSHFKCPISLDLMKDPVTLSTGITFDRECIETWIEAGNVNCPITNRNIGSTTFEPVPNHVLRRMIQDWCLENRSSGVERIPTPRIPVTSYDVTQLLSRLEAASQNWDRSLATTLAAKVRDLARESERNKRCVLRNGATRVLASVFNEFSGDDGASVFEEVVISALAIMVPLEDEAKVFLGSMRSIKAIVELLKNGDLSTRMNALLLLKEIVSWDNGSRVELLMGNEGCLEALVKLIKEPICPITTKASLVTIYHIVSSNEKAKARLVEMSMVSLLLEIVVESDKSVCEKALGVLNEICEREEGRKSCYENALTVPVLVKKVLRVSDLATEFAVSIFWKLGKNDGRVLIEGLQVGAFQKLLLLLQVGCGERTKEKVTELLKLLNLHRERLIECVDSMDFKHIKRPF